jgi:hypothetical protein
MAFGTLGDNYAVSWNDLQDAVNNLYFKAAGTSIPVSDQCIYKGLATLTSYVNLNTANAAYVARATDQLLSKIELQPLAAYSFTVNGYNPDGDGGFIDKATACASSGAARTVYCDTSTIAAGSRLYYFTGTRYVPYILTYAGVDGGLWLYNVSSAFPFTMTSHSSNTVATVDTCGGGGGTTYQYYLATQYDCTSGAVTATNVPVALVTGTTPNYTQYYFASTDLTHAYKLTATNSTVTSLLLNSSASYATYALACATNNSI